MKSELAGVRSVYLVGIGGIGMCGLAFLLKEKGIKVRGSDIADSYNTKMLRDAGIEVFIGHNQEFISQDVDLIGYSSAIKENNPELLEAKRRNITALKRGELLGLLSWDRKNITVAGSHGKTTTTALLAYLLNGLGYEPAAFIGGITLNDFPSNAWWGKDYFVIETDESDESFLKCNSWVSIITNVDYEHIDHYKTFDNLNNSFLKFAYQTKELVIGWGDQPLVKEILSQVNSISYGLQESNIIRYSNFYFDGNYSYFDLIIKDKKMFTVKSPLLGEHNALNVLAAFSFFYYLGEDLNRVKDILLGFKGTKRRFQIKEEIAGVTFVDDYAHHPTEINQVIKAARYLKPKRVMVVFQPHRFSRVKLLQDRFIDCFSYADELVITDIYSASEEEIEGVSSLALYEQIKAGFKGRVHYIPKNKLVDDLPVLLKDGDIVLAVGAGDINKIMDIVADEFRKISVI